MPFLYELPPDEFRKYNIVSSLFKHNCLGEFNTAAEPIPGTVGLPAFPEPAKNTKVLFIISDGEDHEGNISEIVNEAANSGIRIYTIGVGTKGGGPIPVKKNGILQYYKRDQKNQQVITKLDIKKLTDIATKGNGEYVDGSNTSEVVEQVTKILGGMNQKEFEAKQFTDFKDRFQWFLGFSIFLLVFELVLLERKTAWIKKLNLFNED